MGSTLFALAIAASVWFSAVSLAVQFHQERASFIAAVDHAQGESQIN